MKGVDWQGATCPGTPGAYPYICQRAFDFGGFSAPTPGAALRRSSHSFTVRFPLWPAARARR